MVLDLTPHLTPHFLDAPAQYWPTFGYDPYPQTVTVVPSNLVKVKPRKSSL